MKAVYFGKDEEVWDNHKWEGEGKPAMFKEVFNNGKLVVYKDLAYGGLRAEVGDRFYTGINYISTPAFYIVEKYGEVCVYQRIYDGGNYKWGSSVPFDLDINQPIISFNGCYYTLKEAVEGKEKIKAIKAVRQLASEAGCDMGLKEAKDFVETNWEWC
jgi:hypothetical protein